MDFDTGHRSGLAVLQFVRFERGYSPFLIGSDLIRESTGLKMKDDNLLRFVDGVRAVVGDRFYNQAIDFFGIRRAQVIGHDPRVIGISDHEKTRTGDHEKKTTPRIEDVDPLWIGAKLLQFAATWAHLIR